MLIGHVDFVAIPRPPSPARFPYTTLFRSLVRDVRTLTRLGSHALCAVTAVTAPSDSAVRSEEHTSELQSQSNLVCRLLLEKKKAADRYCRSSDLRGPLSDA